MKYGDIKIGMKIRIIDRESHMYLDEGVVLSVVDDLYGGEDIRMRMDSGEIIGGIDPSKLDFE